jgi:hypothetical protein
MNNTQKAARTFLFGVMGCMVAGIGYGYNTKAPAPPAAKVISTPQSRFVDTLHDYRDQYGVAVDNKNSIQKNRITDARDAALCDVDSQVKAWTGKVYRIDTSMIESRLRASVYIQLSKHVWLRGATIDSRDQPELFEKIANLKAGDPILVSGSFAQDAKGCVDEVSLTQYGGMTTPEFRLTYTAIN